MVKQADKARIDRARSALRTALIEMAKAGGARHGDGSAPEGIEGGRKSSAVSVMPSREASARSLG